MDCVLITYFGNNSSRYDEKDFLEKLSKIRRAEEAEGELRVGEMVSIKTKSRIWTAIVKDPHPATERRGKKRKRDGADSPKSPEVPIQSNNMFLGSFTPAPTADRDTDVAILTTSEAQPVLSEASDKQVDLINPQPTQEGFEQQPLTLSAILGDAHLTSMMNTCGQFAAKDDFLSFKAEVQQQLGNITNLLQTVIAQGEEFKMLLCNSRGTPDSFRESQTPSPIVHCTEGTDEHLQFECIGVDTALRTPVREVPIRSVPEDTGTGTQPQFSSTPVGPLRPVNQAKPTYHPTIPLRPVSDYGGIEELLNNQKITSAFQLGCELVKKLFTEDELSTSTITGRKVGGRSMRQLDPAKLQYIDSIIKQRYPMPPSEFATTKSSLRDYIASRCKYLRSKWVKANAENVCIL